MNRPQIRNRIFVWILFLGSISAYSQVKNDFEPRYKNNLRGDITFIANNIVNRQQDGYWTREWVRTSRWRGYWRNVWVPPTSPNDPYNTTGNSSVNNDNLNMQYIDVDNDASTFSSSSATLSVPEPNCSKIRYAGLYWSAVYKYNDGNDSSSGRNNDFNQVKFKIPGGNYVDLTADEILFDGVNDADFGYYGPYACYKDVTSIVTGLPNPDGDYFVANVRASNGSGLSGGISGGWTMVVVYENPDLPGKYITTFDGYAGIKSKETLDIPINGFSTLPNPFPVLAKIGVATLEGDNRITGDGLSIKANSNSIFTPLGNTVNPTNNFFNANITIEDSIIMSRNPNSINTLGWDVDMFTINNSLNKIIPNDETGATLRASSTRDKYDIFFTSFDVEIIEPDIVLEKRVEDIAGNDITGMGVNLGQTLNYVLSFKNTGNDDAVNYTIKDILPINVTLDENNFIFPPGVTYTYDPATRTVVFSIPDDLVNKDDPTYSIRMRVKVAENCFDFVDACSDKIINLAYSTYRGLLNDNEITEDPSIYDFNNCGFKVPGATNFLLDDLADCGFKRTVQICGDNVLLDAGNGFDSYVWYKDNNNNSVVDAGDTQISDGDPDNDPSTISVNDIGTYIVDKIVADPCKGFKEVITVERFGATQTNPIIDYLNTVNSDADPNNDIQGEIVSCSVDGDLLPKIFLCGSNTSEQLQVNIPDALSIVWEQLDEDSCTPAGDDCGNKNGTCTWNQVATGNAYNVGTAGQFRLVLNYQNGCSSRFYFNVFQNNLDIQYRISDIICNTPGNITITNLGNGYGYQLYDVANNTVVVPFSAQNGPSFEIANKGAYRVDVVQLDSSGVPIDGSCIFSTPDIGIRDRDFQVNITSSPANCKNLGNINIQALNVEPNYTYELWLDDGSNGGQGSLVDDETAQPDNNFTFQNLNPDNYIVVTKTDDGCIDTQKVKVDNIQGLSLDARVSQNITCKEGNILMNSSGGKPPYTYAIWSYTDTAGNGGDLYASVGDMPPSAFQPSVIFDVWDPGDYTFIVVDRNNCYAFSNRVNIQLVPAADFDPTTVTDVLCYGTATGSIIFNLADNHGYKLTYYLYETATFDDTNYNYGNALATNTSGNFPGLTAGDYTIVVNQKKGSASCDYIEQQTISAPTSALSAEAVLVQEYTCTQLGIVKAQNVIGGSAPYQYSIDGVNFVGTDTFSNLTAGNYTITVRDANSCTFVTDPIALDPLNPPSDLTFSSTAPTCPSITSDLTTTVVNGNAPFSFEIIAPAAVAATSTSGDNASFDDLAPGTYTFKVTDAKGCEYTESYTISPITPISVNGKFIRNITCIDDTDGRAEFVVSGFGTSFDYSITGPSNFSGTAQTNGNISLNNLDDGTYTITVTDNTTQCTATADVTIAAPTAALALNVNENQPTCTDDGSVILTANNGWGGYSYTIVYPDGTTTFTNGTGSFGSLGQLGTYSVSVTDANGCEVADSFDLNAAVAPVLAITANSTCYVAANGLELTANVTSGGDGNFEYSLNGGTYTTNNVFPGLAAGTYTIAVRDGKNCTGTNTITIDPELTVSASASNITTCATTTDVTITAAGGDGNYVYAIVTDGGTPAVFSTTNPVSVTGTGDYDIYVRDNNGNTGYCEALYNITISQDPAVAISESHLDVSCNGNNDGSITLGASGGAGNYTYSIDGGTNYFASGIFKNLTAGTYNAVVRDKNNCPATTTITITEPAVISATASATDYTCAAESQITVNNVVGGSGSYQYSIDGQTGWLPSGGTTATTYTFTPTFTDGTYVVKVRDFNAQTCSFNTSVTIAPLPVAPALNTSTTYNCDGSGNLTVTTVPGGTYEYQLEDIGGTPIAGFDYASQGGNNVFANVPVGNYVARVNYGAGNAALGTTCNTTIAASIDSGHGFGATVATSVDVSCNGSSNGSITIEVHNFGAGGFEYSLDNFATTLGTSTSSPVTINALTAGNYIITVRDVDDPIAGCTLALNQNIAEPAILTVSHVLTPKTCVADGSVTVSATGGTGGYLYELEQPDNTILGPQSGTVFNGLSQPGTYTITVSDSNGCATTDTFDIVEPAIPVASIDPSSSLCYSSGSLATIVVGASSGLAPYFYSINGGPTQTSNTFSDLTPDTYTFTVMDSNGCTDDIVFTIEPELTAHVVLTKDIDCSASPDAVLDLTVNGGYSPFTYEMDVNGAGYSAFGGAFPYSTSVTGTYRFRVTDSRGCVGESNTVNVTAAVAPVATATATDPTCNGESNGIVEINIDPNFGSSPYQINFNGLGYSSKTVYTNLAAGTYSYTVRDSKSCTYTDTVTLTDPVLFDANVVPTDVSCGGAGVGDIPGKIDITITSGGVPNFTYTLYDNQNNIVATTGPNPITNTSNTSVTFDGLGFGDYYVRVIDANGCEYYENPVRVLSNPYLTLNSNVIVDCATGGTVNVSADSGSGNYIFSIYGTGTPPNTIVPGATPTEEIATFTGLNAGQSYVFQVIDTDTGCSSYVDADIPNLSSIDVVATPTVTDVTCSVDTNGSISFQIEGYDATVTDLNYSVLEALSNIPATGSGTYSGTITGAAGGPSPVTTITDLEPGDYILYFEEATSPFCSNTYPFRILEPTPVILSLVDQNNANCNSDAQVTVNASGGTKPYTYAFVQDGAVPAAGDYTGSNYAELDPGINTDWDVYVKDVNGCLDQLDVIIAADPEPLISAIVTNQCAADEGNFTIQVTLDNAGVGPYQLSLDGGAFQSAASLNNAGDTYNFTGLSSGTHTVELKDANDCGNSIPNIDIYPPSKISVEVRALPTCLGKDGEILIKSYGGSGSYLYELFDGAVSVTGGPQISPIFTGLDAKSYTAFIYDQLATGCDASTNITLSVPPAVLFTTTKTDVTCNGGSDGSIAVTLDPSMVNYPYTYALYDSPVGALPIAGPQTSNTFTGLTAKDYVVRVTSSRLCFTDEDVTIGEPGSITVPAPTVAEFACGVGNNPNSAVITIDDSSITGGSGNYTRFEFINTTLGTTVQNGTNTQYKVTNPAGGNFTINVYDDRGCSATTTAVVAPYVALTDVTVTPTDPTCNPGTNGEVKVDVALYPGLGATNLKYDITGTDVVYTDTFSGNIDTYTFTGLDIGNYLITVTNTTTQCILQRTVRLRDPNTFKINVNVTADVVCYGSATGTAIFSITDAVYTAGFDYQVFEQGTNAPMTAVLNHPSLGPTPAVNLPQGDYYVSITQDSNPLCANQKNFSISGPSAAVTANTAVTPITCVGSDGVIEITDAQGGWGGFAYYVGTAAPTGVGDYVSGPRFDALAPGTYQAWVRDANGCEELIQDNILLADPAPISATLQINQENCTNLQGEIQVLGTTGGQGSNYTYQLIKDGVPYGSPQTSDIFSGLGAGTYEVQISDQWSCAFTTPAEILYQEINITATVVKPMDCTAVPGGEITITAQGGSANLEYTATFPDGTTTLTNTDGIFTGLNQDGLYSFTVRDLDTSAPVCEKTVTQSLDAPTPVTFTGPDVVDVSCYGLSDGSITVKLMPKAAGVNDNPVYTYNLYDATGTNLLAGPQTNPTFSGLSATSYQIEAVSSRGCSDRQTVEVKQPTELLIDATATTFNCNANNVPSTATITVAILDGATTPGIPSGTGPYLYSLDNVNFQTSNTFTIIDTGVQQPITVYVRDGNSCPTTDNVTIEPLNKFTAGITRDVAISCTGPEQVTLTVSDDGNTANVYTYELLPIGNTNATQTGTPTYNTATFDLTAVGDYTFRVTDTATGCYVDTATYTIAPYDLIKVQATATTPVTCYGDASGALEIDVTGYTGTYNYEVFDGSGNLIIPATSADTSANPRPITGLTGGNYFVRVTETNSPSCTEDSNSVTIASPTAPLTGTLNFAANVTCTNDAGELFATASGGWGGYEYQLINNTTSTTVQDFDANNIFVGLSAGDYTLNVRDSKGCIITDTAQLDRPDPITAGISATPTMLACYGDTNATISAINTLGGQGSYQYQLNYYDPTGAVIDYTTGGQTSPIFDNLGAGIYSITVSDGWDCDVETAKVTIVDPTGVTSNLVRTRALSCTQDAMLLLTASGGTGPYEYSVDGINYVPMAGGNTHSFVVPAGSYRYYVRDSFGCKSILSNEIKEDPIAPLTLDIDDTAAIVNCNGESTATIISEADGGLGNYRYELFSDATLSNSVAGPNATGKFENLVAGDYYVQVTSADCILSSNVIQITEPTPLSITDDFTDISCNGANDGSITVELSGGSGGYQYAISPNLNKFDSVNTFTDLAPGTYSIIAQDMNGCFELLEYTLTEPTVLDIVPTVTPEICAGSEDGTISLAITGGTAPYRTSLNSNNAGDYVLDQMAYSGLAAGTYVVFVKDDHGCESNIVVDIAPGVNLNATVEPVYECTGDTPDNHINVTLEDQTVAADVLYALDSTDPNAMQLDPDFSNMAPGAHYLTIAHANGCTYTINFNIGDFEPLALALEQNNINEITAVATGGKKDYKFQFNEVDNGSDNTFFIKKNGTYTVTVTDENGCVVSANIEMEFIDVEIPNFFTPDGDGKNDFWAPKNTEAYPQILTVIFDRYGREVARMGIHDKWNGLYRTKDLPSGDYWYIIKLNGEADDREFVGHFTLYR
ncbi:T9SS type B sorting domain-containing protein [Flavobacteriaceae bacterium F89]|uniref:T9SS type B sorting domain-containing protein n=1 Tax=Cerina litoralis TaxID=2874477 RepID=A0AAE3ET48_9FLAO|nr:T9SS type B sorting domain-containing protein [Cerina litoralis]MCG2459221.1 T9SS type B sorting domain-containing protein [Cerina litoralis]